MKYVYGPVPSRRLGRSLGVSPIPAKSCNYSCIYCQLGATGHLCTERRSFFPPDDILNEIRSSLRSGNIDYITFVGDGEPTLNSDLGYLLQETKKMTDIPLAVITNGSLFYRQDVRRELAVADLVMPSLDAADEKTWRRINRGDSKISYKMLVDGLRQFKKENKCEFWLQVMLIKGINDSPEQLIKHQTIIKSIGPDKVCITTAVRPPAEDFVLPPDEETVRMAESVLGSSCAYSERETGQFSTAGFTCASEAILSVAARHPLRLEQAYKIEEQFMEKGIADNLLKTNELQLRKYEDIEYIFPTHKKG